MVTLLAGMLLGATAHRDPCRTSLPRGPSVPAPIVMRTNCGGWRLARDGRVTRLPRRWFAKHVNNITTGFGAGFAIRPTKGRRIVVAKDGRVVWRSQSLYPDFGGEISFGPGRFAFASYERGIFLTDLVHPERLVLHGRGLYPYGFTHRGELVVSARHAVVVISPEGKPVRTYRYRERNGFAFDGDTDTLYFVTRDGLLATANGAEMTLVRKLDGVDGTMSLDVHGLLVFQGNRDWLVTQRDGMPVARARWSGRQWASDSGVNISPDGRTFLYRLTKAHIATVYRLRIGEQHAQAIYRHRLGQSGCAGDSATMTWLGTAVLYNSTDGELAVFDSGKRARRLTALARALPHRGPANVWSVGWQSEFGR